jgi:acetate kinase
MGLLEIEFEEKRHAANEDMTSAETSGTPVRVISTDAERMIAKTVCRLLGLD